MLPPDQAPNPYAAPHSYEPSFAPNETDLIDASTGQRFATYLIDMVGFTVLGVVALVLVEASTSARAVPEFVLNILVMSIYYIGFEATLGRTPGKLIMGTCVVNETGGRPSFMQILGRTLIRFMPFEPFSAFGGGQMWHDSWSSTRVVSTR